MRSKELKLFVGRSFSLEGCSLKGGPEGFGYKIKER